jgi:TPR repeat protein
VTILLVLWVAPGASSAPTTRQVTLMDAAPLRRLADAGNDAARVELARRMLLGKRAKIDPQAAVALLQKSAEAGSAAAKYELALCYRLGQGVKSDDGRAEKLLGESAEAGHVPAMAELWERSLANAKPSTAPATRPSTRPVAASATPQAAGDDERELDPTERMIRLARRGEPAALLAVARAVNRRQIRGVDASEALPFLLKAAAGEDDRVALAAVELILKGDPPVKADRPRAVSLYRKLAETPLRGAQEALAALAPESFKGLAADVSTDRLFQDEEMIGTAVEVHGTITTDAAGAKEFAVRTAGSARDLTLAVPAVETAANAKAGRVVRAWGVLESPGRVRGLLVEIDEPKYQLRYDVVSPQVIRGGRTKRYVVEGELRNTSRQRISLAELRIRVFQPDTPNDETETVELKSIDPGERREFKQVFSLEDFRDRASNQKPRVEIAVERLDW